MSSKTYLVSRRLRPLTDRDFLPLKKVLPRPPAGYIPYLKKYGSGMYCGFLTIFTPRELVDELSKNRQAVRWLRNGAEVTPDDELLNPDDLVPIGQSIDGDLLVVNPRRRATIYAMPRHDYCPYLLPDGFKDLLHWRRLDASRKQLFSKPEFRYFESFENREVRFFIPERCQRVADIRKWFSLRFPQRSMKVLKERDDTDFALLFLRTLEAIVQVTCSDIRIAFDTAHRETVRKLSTELEVLGYRER